MRVVCTAGNRNKLTAGKSEKGKWLNCAIPTFARRRFGITLVKLLAAKEPHVLLFPKLLWMFDKLSSLYFLLIKITRHSLSIISKTVAAAGDIRTLHTVGAKQTGWVQLVYQSLIWRSRQLNSERYVKRKWLCTLVTSGRYVRYYVDIRCM